MSDRWSNGVVEFLLPKRIVSGFGFCLLFVLILGAYVNVLDTRDETRINKEIEEAQKYFNQEEYAAAFDVLAEAYQYNYRRVFDRDALIPLSEKGDQLLKTVTSGVFSGYGLPYQGRYEIKDPVYLYLYIPQPGEELYNEGSFYFGYSEEELLSREEIFEVFSRPESIMEYWELEYRNGLDGETDPCIYLRIRKSGENNSGLNPYGITEFYCDYTTGCIKWDNDIILSHVE